MENEYTKLTIEIMEDSERQAIFLKSCELLSLNADKEAQKLKLEHKRDGYTPSSNDLLVFCLLNSLNGQFEFREEKKLFIILVPTVPSVGKAAIETPETIKPTSVDAVVVEQEKKPEPDVTGDASDDFKSVGSSMEMPMTEEEDDDDDTPF